MTTIDRRRFLRTATVASAVPSPSATGSGPTRSPPRGTPGPGPYGPPGAPVLGTAYTWHPFSDGSGCFPLPDGGCVLASNAEVPGIPSAGGASSIGFAKDGSVVGARRILGETTMN